jgi:hypothetical protein
LLLDVNGIVKVRQWNFIASLLASLHKDVVILDEINQKLITNHLINIAQLNSKQLFELMYFIIANESVVRLLNSGKVHEQIKSLLALQKYLVKRYAATIATNDAKHLALTCQQMCKLIDISSRPKCAVLFNKSIKPTAAKYRDKDLTAIWEALNERFISLKPKLSPRDFCDIVVVFCLAGILDEGFFCRESVKLITANPQSFKVIDIVTLLRIATTFERKGDMPERVYLNNCLQQLI